MGLQMRKLWLATSCGSPREYDGQYRSEVWSDPPRAVTLIEWITFLEGWHRIIHAAGYHARGKGWPPEPPSIFRFSESFDLPLASWAIETAKLHGWQDMLALAERQAERHRYLASLTREARLELFKVERWMRRLAQDRDWALNGWVQTASGPWHWHRHLLMETT